MFERIDTEYLIIVGLAGCKVENPERSLRRLRMAFPDAQVQLMRADRIAGREHLFFAARNAVRAFDQGRNVSRSLAVEFLRYAACQRQISKAIATLGLVPGTKDIAVVAFVREERAHDRLLGAAKSELGGTPDDSIIEAGYANKVGELEMTYGITRREVNAARLAAERRETVLKRLIIERSALVALED